MGSPSLAAILVSVFVLVVDVISSAVQEYRPTQIMVTRSNLNKKLVFIKNQFKN